MMNIVPECLKNFICPLCDVDYHERRRLNFHLFKIHKIDRRIYTIQCYIQGCEAKFKRRMELVNHLRNVHQKEILVYNKVIDSYDEFLKWKNEIEGDSGYTWVNNNNYRLRGLLRKTYICNRSVAQGSKIFHDEEITSINRLPTFCLSSIKLYEIVDGKFTIEFIETHNHED